MKLGKITLGYILDDVREIGKEEGYQTKNIRHALVRSIGKKLGEISFCHVRKPKKIIIFPSEYAFL